MYIKLVSSKWTLSVSNPNILTFTSFAQLTSAKKVLVLPSNKLAPEVPLRSKSIVVVFKFEILISLLKNTSNNDSGS